MPHIHTKPGEHDHTASAYIVRTDLGNEPKIMLHKHKKLGVYMQFGGHIETTETPWRAIVHELLEESGYGIEQLKILQPKERMKVATGVKLHPMPVYQITHKFNDTHFHTDIAYGFVADRPPKHQAAEDETGEFNYFTRQELAKLPVTETAENVREACLFVLDVCLKEWEEVSAKDCN